MDRENLQRLFDVQQPAVAGDGGRKGLGEVLQHVGREGNGGIRGVQQGALVLPGHGQALGVDVQVPGDHQGRNVVLKQPGKAAGTSGALAGG